MMRLDFKQKLNQVLEEETNKKDFFNIIEYMVLLPATTYVSVRSIADWEPSITYWWLLFFPSAGSALFRYLQNKNLKFILNKVFVIIVIIVIMCATIYIAAQIGLDIPQIWWTRVISFFSI